MIYACRWFNIASGLLCSNARSAKVKYTPAEVVMMVDQYTMPLSSNGCGALTMI
jgi:hypothetical protein